MSRIRYWIGNIPAKLTLQVFTPAEAFKALSEYRMKGYSCEEVANNYREPIGTPIQPDQKLRKRPLPSIATL